MANANEVNIEATVKRILYQKDGFAIFTTVGDLLSPEQTVQGEIRAIKPGMKVSIVGNYVDTKRGKQIKATAIFPTATMRKEGVDFNAEELITYLGCGIIAGIGEAKARKIVEAFGKETEEVLRRDPQRLATVKGISPEGAASICAQWTKGEEVHDIFRFLSAHGLSLSKAASIHDTMGPGCIDTIKGNPYTLCQVEGIGFKTADAVAQSVGLSKNSVDRIRHGIEYYFNQEVIRGTGSTGARRGMTIHSAAILLGLKLGDVEVVLDDMIANGQFIADPNDDIIFHPAAYEAERSVAANIARLIRKHDNNPKLLAQVIAGSEQRNNVKLSESQKKAISTLLSSSVSILTGAPGTGKTTILKVLLDAMAGHKIALCAPAGKAAKRMEESTGLDASTIHRLLEVNPATGKFIHDKDNKLDINLLIMDEGSMADVFLASALLEALPDQCKIILVGDNDQLQSVGAGRVLGDLIKSSRMPVARLTENRRFSSDSGIGNAARAINAGKKPVFTGEDGDLPLYKATDSADGLAMTIELVTKILPAKGIPIDDIQVLTPAKSGNCGTSRINEELQKLINPNASIEGRYISVFGRKLALGDRVIQTSNNYDLGIFNGDAGKIVNVNTERGEVNVDFGGTMVRIGADSLSSLDLYYAGTIHKSQGSEFPHVVMTIFPDHFKLLKRNLVYTGYTRGREAVYTVTDQALKAIGMAAGNDDSNSRITSLNKHLVKMMNEWGAEPVDEPAAEDMLAPSC